MNIIWILFSLGIPSELEILQNSFRVGIVENFTANINSYEIKIF